MKKRILIAVLVLEAMTAAVDLVVAVTLARRRFQ